MMSIKPDSIKDYVVHPEIGRAIKNQLLHVERLESENRLLHDRNVGLAQTVRLLKAELEEVKNEISLI